MWQGHADMLEYSRLMQKQGLLPPPDFARMIDAARKRMRGAAASRESIDSPPPRQPADPGPVDEDKKPPVATPASTEEPSTIAKTGETQPASVPQTPPGAAVPTLPELPDKTHPAPRAFPVEAPPTTSTNPAPTLSSLPSTADGRRAAFLREMFPAGRPATLSVKEIQQGLAKRKDSTSSKSTAERALRLAWPRPSKIDGPSVKN
jgi:hypothetical protein